MSWIALESVYCSVCNKMFNRRDSDHVSCPTCGRDFHLVVYPYCPKCGNTLAIDGVSRTGTKFDGVWTRDTKIPGKAPDFRCMACNEVVPGAVMEAPSVVREREDGLKMIMIKHLLRGREVTLPIAEIISMGVSPDSMRDVLQKNPDIELGPAMDSKYIMFTIKFKESGAKRARWLSITDDDGSPLPIPPIATRGEEKAGYSYKKPRPIADLPAVRTIKQSRSEDTIVMMKRLAVTFKAECEEELHARKIAVASKQDLIGAILDLFMERVAREIAKKKPE